MHSHADIAAALNAKDWTRKAMRVSRKHIGDLVSLDTSVDTFPGEVVLDCRRFDGEPWTAALVAAEMPKGPLHTVRGAA